MWINGKASFHTRSKFGWSFMIAVLGLVLAVGCGGSNSAVLGSPERPFDKPILTVTVSPNPVPYSGQPIDTAVCAGKPYTWFFNEVFTESGGILVKLTSVTQHTGPNAGVPFPLVAPASNPNAYTVPANGSLTIPWPTCLLDSTGTTIQHTFAGTDFNNLPVTVDGPLVVLAGK